MPTTAFQPLDNYDWRRIQQELDAQGWAILPALFTPGDARRMAQEAVAGGSLLPSPSGHGERLALIEAAPATLRAELYRRLLPIARAWAAALDLEVSYPEDLAAYTQRNRQAGQARSLSAIQRLRQDDYQPLLQYADGACVFPLRLIALLSEPGQDHTGGETVMTEQRPRMQSRPKVLPLALGDAAVLAVSHRPVQSAQGVYRVTERQAVSRVRSGERIALELMLHDGP
ncbi:2OG-Fe(II) oxygenase [Achromobacter sp.]|uniref:2OG-Fe(II) oxygenase n=1 Tax=Achromobacter sp. TaxID=134375 RepID=UPI0028AB920F|nr:2OG-Fe(II) oxygenase [Achromobacter sp.]